MAIGMEVSSGITSLRSSSALTGYSERRTKRFQCFGPSSSRMSLALRVKGRIASRHVLLLAVSGHLLQRWPTPEREETIAGLVRRLTPLSQTKVGRLQLVHSFGYSIIVPGRRGSPVVIAIKPVADLVHVSRSPVFVFSTTVTMRE